MLKALCGFVEGQPSPRALVHLRPPSLFPFNFHFEEHVEGLIRECFCGGSSGRGGGGGVGDVDVIANAGV